MNLYPKLLGARFAELPTAVRAFHDPDGRTVWRGAAHVERGRGLVAGLACRAFGFPAEGTDVPVVLTVTPERDGERWDRDFGGRIMSTFQHERGERLVEYLGPVRIHMAPVLSDARLSVRPVGWAFLGIPLPKVLMPTTENFETDTDGMFRFHVEIAAPFAGPIVTYRGWLELDGS